MAGAATPRTSTLAPSPRPAGISVRPRTSTLAPSPRPAGRGLGEGRWIDALTLAVAVALAACGDDAAPPPDDDAALPPARDAARPRDEDAAPPTPTFAITTPANVALPFAIVGSAVFAATFEVREIGGAASSGPLTYDASGDFVIEGSTDAIAANETRTFTLRFTGDASIAQNVVADATLSVDGIRRTFPIAAVVGDPDLPPSLAWADEDGVSRATAPFPSAPFPDSSASYTDASVLVAYPSDLDDTDGVPIVTHLHGHRATLATTVPEQHLVRQFGISGRNVVLVVPQGPVDAADGNFGKLAREGGFARLVRDVIAVLYRDGIVHVPRVGPVVLTSHSGGYVATAQIIERGGLPIAATHLFDSLYGSTDVYESFASSGAIFRSVYTSGGGTDEQNRALASRLDGAGVSVASTFDDDTLATSRTTIGFTPSAHGACVSDERLFARWLFASGLPRRPGAPPELLATRADGTEAHVSWRAENALFAGTFVVEGSDDGVAWDVMAETTETDAHVPLRARIRVRARDTSGTLSDPSDVYGALGSDWLIVDAFDRVLDGSYRGATHDFAALVANATGTSFSIASNEAVARGDVDLGAYRAVVWLLGDESRADRTFDEAERAHIDAFVASGGALVVSGSEVGFATDATWLSSTLGARYVSDDAATDRVESWTFGVTYEEDYPDVLEGDSVLWRYATGGAAAVLRSDAPVVVVGFPLETMPEADRTSALTALSIALGLD